MGRIRKSVWMSVLIILLVEGWFFECKGCRKQERDALLHLKVEWLQNDLLNTWVNGTDCCQWEWVECNNTTRRVSKLFLGWTRNNLPGNWNVNLSDFEVFDDIKSLDLSGNNITGFVENKGNKRFSTRLEDLALSNNNLGNDIISSLTRFQHLKSLDLNNNQLEGLLNISGLCTLSKLELLNLSYQKNKIIAFVVHQGATNICLDSMKVLYLVGLKMDGSMLRESLKAFSSIRKLAMSSNIFNGTIIAEDFRDLVNLDMLSLDLSSGIGKEFFKSIEALTSLKILSLRSCGIMGSVSNTGWSKLKKLEELYLSSNELEGSLDSYFINTTSLQILDLSDNFFTGNLAPNLATFTSLELLDLSSNQSQVFSSFKFLANYSNLKFIDISGNRVMPDSQPTFQTWVPKFQLEEFHFSSTTGESSVPFPNFLIHQYNLTTIEFHGIKFHGNFPNWLLSNNTKLKELHLRNCSFTGHFQLPSHVNPYLAAIDISYNSIMGQFPSNISAIFPNLEHLYMSNNVMNGSIPFEFGEMLEALDLSDNHFSGKMPRNLSMNGSKFETLILSNNELDGSVCPTLAIQKVLRELYLDGNNFSGSIPSWFFNSSLSMLDISSNHFVGKLPNGVGNLSVLLGLFMANNHLEGSIPSKITEQPFLRYLDLSGNNFSGSIPSFVKSSAAYVLLNNNRFSGLATTMFNKNLSSVMLDLSNNNIASKIEHLIGSISQLNILLLRGNHFMGHIPSQICQLTGLTMVDISYNSLSGPIPNCLGKIPFEAPDESSPYFYNEDWYGTHVRVPFTTKRVSYTYKGIIVRYMSGMDLSHNNLTGIIPPELGNLTNIRAMNFSHNQLRGQIPTTFSNLKQVESLDLSFNNLSGEIPHQLIELTSLEVFSLAHNNLSGSTPERKDQFLTFDRSSYEGNPFLCGPPLDKSYRPSGIFPNASDAEVGNNCGIMDMETFYISFLVSYASILLVMAAILYINPHWRRAWFYFIEYLITYCYYYFHKWFTVQDVAM